MARSHVATGGCVLVVGSVMGLLSWQGGAAVRVAVLASGLVLAGTLLPDIDHRNSVVSRAWVLWWWLPGSHTVSWLVRVWARWVYAMTRTEEDPESHSAHRGLTHSLGGTVLLASVVTVGCSPVVPVWVAAGTVGVLCGTAARGLSRDFQLPVTVVMFVVGLVSPELQSGWPVWWLAVWVGCAVHCLGDGCSEGGVPWWWPVVIDGQRWRHVYVLPRVFRFATGYWGEQVMLAVIYAVTVGLVWWQLGL